MSWPWAVAVLSWQTKTDHMLLYLKDFTFLMEIWNKFALEME